MKKLKSIFLLITVLCLLVTNACRKQEAAFSNSDAINPQSYKFDFSKLKPAVRVQMPEVLNWINNNISVQDQTNLQMNNIAQTYIDYHHVIRIPIKKDAALFFTKDKGELKAFAYKWDDATPGTKLYTGHIISFSFQDPTVRALKYYKGKKIIDQTTTTSGNIIDVNSATGIKLTTTSKLKVNGIIGDLWCILTGGTPYALVGSTGNGCDRSSGWGSVIYTFIRNAFSGSDEGSNSGYEDPNGSADYGSDPESPQGIWYGPNIPSGPPSSGGSPASQPYQGGSFWVSRWVTGGCIAPGGDDPNNGGGGGPIGLPGDDGSGCAGGSSGYWESVEVPIPPYDREIDGPLPTDSYTDPETGTTYQFSDIQAIFDNDPTLAYNLDEENLELINPPGGPILISVMLTRAVAAEAATLKTIHPFWPSSKIWATATWNVMGLGVHLTLDALGFVPAFGAIPDLINSGIYYIEGDKISCAMSASAAIPVWEFVAIGGKWVKSSVKVMALPITEKAIKTGIKVIKAGKDIRFIKVAVNVFDHAALKAASFVKPASATLTNLSRSLIDKYAIRIAPTETALKNIIDDIVLHGDALGTKTEQLADAMFQKEGYVKFDSKIGSNNGFDNVYIKGDPANPTDILININESKQMTSAGSIKLNAGNQATGLAPQMSETWIDQVINTMQANTNSNIQNLGNVLKNNRASITKSVTAVDKSTGEIVVLKLESY